MSDKIRKELEQLRGKISQAKLQLSAAEDERVPREQAEMQLDRMLAAKAEEGRINVYYLAEGKQPPYLDPRSMFSLFCWIDPDTVRNRFRKELDRIYADGNPGRISSDRSEAMRRLTSELFDLEVLEERLIIRAEESGLRLPRRGDADPAAVLEA
jgi:hypothetical protein